MALITLRILDGPERGTAYHQLAVPVSVGREDGNVILLNDERVSRFHLKIHENGGEILLTDLQSTNGTRVNGEAVHVWQLRPGDVISLGRSLLVFGSSDEIAKRLAALNKQDQSSWIPMGVEGDDAQFLQRTIDGRERNVSSSLPFEMEIFRGMSPEERLPMVSFVPDNPLRNCNEHIHRHGNFAILLSRCAASLSNLSKRDSLLLKSTVISSCPCCQFPL